MQENTHFTTKSDFSLGKEEQTLITQKAPSKLTFILPLSS